MYPREGAQPLAEDALLSGPIEPTSRAYAVAKLAGVEFCRAVAQQDGLRFRVLIPATLYGPHDHFGTTRAHVIPALIERFHAARVERRASVTVLGTGRARREFLHVDDAAAAAVALLSAAEAPVVVNAGAGSDLSIRELAQLIARTVGFAGELAFDASAPDGAPRKLLDSTRMAALGWQPRVALESGLAQTYDWYRKHVDGKRPGARSEPKASVVREEHPE
jgi:GDP-L-fucose synthase